MYIRFNDIKYMDINYIGYRLHLIITNYPSVYSIYEIIKLIYICFHN